MTSGPARRSAGTRRRVVLADGTYDAIQAMIRDHHIAPGEHVGIDELSRSLSVSQTPVREALARLESDGLVTKIPLRGYQATELLSPTQFDELFQFRALIEPWAAGEAARRSTRRDIDALRSELERAERLQVSRETSTYPEFTDHDTRLHTLIARASGNAFVEAAFVRTHCHLHLVRLYRASVAMGEQESTENTSDASFVGSLFSEYYGGGRRPLAVVEHAEIVAAIAAGAGESAAELMLQHIESSRQRFAPAVEALNGPD